MAISLFFTASYATEIIDEQLGYSISLPGNWVRDVVNDTIHRFRDTTDTYLSGIGIVRSDFSADTLFDSPEEWTRANFIGYAIVIDADPFSTLLFYDTVTAKQDGNLRADDAFSITYSDDAQLFDWGEYIRFTASGTFGFELYAIGELDDMNANIEFYLNILNSIIITLESPVILPRRIAAPAAHTSKTGTPYQLNLLGRRINHLTREKASQIVIDHDRRSGMLR
jgi:hypothetical protein